MITPSIWFEERQHQIHLPPVQQQYLLVQYQFLQQPTLWDQGTPLAQGTIALDFQIWVELVDMVELVLDSWSFSRCKSS
jgi:hypothetical protein